MDQKTKRGKSNEEGRDVTLDKCSFCANSTSFERKRFRSAQDLRTSAPAGVVENQNVSEYPSAKPQMTGMASLYVVPSHHHPGLSQGFVLTAKTEASCGEVGPFPLR